MIARRHRENALVPFAVGPVRDAASRSLARRPVAALALVHPPHPQLLARLGIDRDDGAAHAGLRVHDAIDHERRHLHVVVGPGTEVVGLEPPRDAQVPGVLFVDLIERGILRAARVAGVRAPFAVRRPVLCRERHGGDDEHATRARTLRAWKILLMRVDVLTEVPARAAPPAFRPPPPRSTMYCLPPDHVRHRNVRDVGRNLHLRHDRAGRLVVRAEPRHRLTVDVIERAALAGPQQCFGHHDAGSAGAPGARNRRHP